MRYAASATLQTTSAQFSGSSDQDKKAEIGKAKLKLVEIQTEMKDAQKAMERERKALSDAKAEQTKIESGRLKIVRNVRTALDEYQNKKQEVQEAVQDRRKWIWKNSSASWQKKKKLW